MVKPFSTVTVSTHMPLARHDGDYIPFMYMYEVSTHMPLARHDHMSCLIDIVARFLLTCLLRGMTVHFGLWIDST